MLTRKSSSPIPIRSLKAPSGHQEQPAAIRSTKPAGQPGRESLRPRQQPPPSSAQNQAARRTRQQAGLDTNCPRCPTPIRSLKALSGHQEQTVAIKSTKPAGQPGRESLRPRQQPPPSSAQNQAARRTQNVIRQHKLKAGRAGTKTSWTPQREPAGGCFSEGLLLEIVTTSSA